MCHIFGANIEPGNVSLWSKSPAGIWNIYYNGGSGKKKKTTRLYSHCHRSSWKKKSILLRLNNPSSQVFFVLVKSINKCIFLYSVNVFTNWSRFLTHVKPICQHISQTVFAVVYSAMMEQVWICVGPAFSDTEAQSITKHIDQFLCKTCIMYY